MDNEVLREMAKNEIPSRDLVDTFRQLIGVELLIVLALLPGNHARNWNTNMLQVDCQTRKPSEGGTEARSAGSDATSAASSASGWRFPPAAARLFVRSYVLSIFKSRTQQERSQIALEPVFLFGREPVLHFAMNFVSKFIT